MTSKDFLTITIRGRFAFGICCIENAITKFEFDHLNWDLLFEFLWRYPLGNEIKDLALWHENESECMPFCVLDEKEYEQMFFDYLTKQQFNTFLNLYRQSNPVICELIDLTAQIGTQSLYGGVRDGSPVTLEYTERIISLLKSNTIPLPDFDNFKEFTYEIPAKTDWVVWGNKIEYNTLKRISTTLK